MDYVAGYRLLVPTRASISRKVIFATFFLSGKFQEIFGMATFSTPSSRVDPPPPPPPRV